MAELRATTPSSISSPTYRPMMNAPVTRMTRLTRANRWTSVRREASPLTKRHVRRTGVAMSVTALTCPIRKDDQPMNQLSHNTTATYWCGFSKGASRLSSLTSCCGVWGVAVFPPSRRRGRSTSRSRPSLGRSEARGGCRPTSGRRGRGLAPKGPSAPRCAPAGTTPEPACAPPRPAPRRSRRTARRRP